MWCKPKDCIVACWVAVQKMNWKMWRPSSSRLLICHPRDLSAKNVHLKLLCGETLAACQENTCIAMQVEASIESLLARQQQLQGKREQLCRTITLNSRAPKADWQGNFAWDAELDHLLNSAFALASFRFPFYSFCIWQPVQCTASLYC